MEEYVEDYTFGYNSLLSLPGMPTNRDVMNRYLALLHPNRESKPNSRLSSVAQKQVFEELVEIAQRLNVQMVSSALLKKRFKNLIEARQSVVKHKSRLNQATLDKIAAFNSFLNENFEFFLRDASAQPFMQEVPAEDNNFENSFGFSQRSNAHEISFGLPYQTASTSGFPTVDDEYVLSQSRYNELNEPDYAQPGPSTSDYQREPQVPLSCLETIESRRITQDQFHEQITNANVVANSEAEVDSLRENAQKKLENIANTIDINRLPKNVVEALLSAKRAMSATVQTPSHSQTDRNDSNPFYNLGRVQNSQLSQANRSLPHSPANFPESKRQCFSFSSRQISDALEESRLNSSNQRNAHSQPNPYRQSSVAGASRLQYASQGANTRVASYFNPNDMRNAQQFLEETEDLDDSHALFSRSDESEEEEDSDDDNDDTNDAFFREIPLSQENVQQLEEINESIQNRLQNSTSRDFEDEESDSNCDDEDDEDFVPNNEPRRNANENKTDIFDSDFISILDRFNVSSRAATAIVAAVLIRLEQIIQTPLSNILCSTATIHRRRQTGRRIIYEKIKRSALNEDYITVHWDGIKLPDHNGPGKVHRLIITLSGSSNKELFMGSHISPEGAEGIAELIQTHLRNWNLENKIKSLCFDTTYTNSGQRNGVVAYLAARRDLLFCACRHHIAELMLTWIYKKGIIASGTVGPSDLTFNDFGSKWQSIKSNSFDTMENDRDAWKHLSVVADDLKDFLYNQLETRQPRNDYMVLIKLSLIVLGEESLAEDFSWLGYLPGISHARWMSKMIYSILMYLFRNSYRAPEGSELTPNSIRMFVIFGLRVYLKFFLQAPIAIMAPMNDLRLLKEIYKFQFVNRSFADIVFKGFKKHMWYLSEQLVPFAFFDTDIPNAIKNEMRMNYLTKDSISSNQKRFTFNNETTMENFRTKKIADFVTKGSCSFFRILEISDEFLRVDANEWETNQSFIAAKKRIKGLSVVNDSAERGVALTKFSNRISRKENFYQDRMMSVVDNRQRVQSHTRANLFRR